MEITFKGKGDAQEYSYTYREDLTGQDFLEIRRLASATGLTHSTYGHANLVVRLTEWTRPERLSEEALLNLKQDVYHVLYTIGNNLDNRDIEDANSFLMGWLGLSLPGESPSISEDSSQPQPDSPEPLYSKATENSSE